ncbi:MAG: hypothetical protein ACRDM2_01625 [Gaiellaceae bacterium]
MAFRTSAATIGLAGALLLAGCGGGMPDEEVVAGPTTPSPPAATTATEPGAPAESDAPPPVTVHFFDQAVALRAWTYCYGNLCADGSPPAAPPDVGSPEEVLVEFPLPDWSFTASFQPAGKPCGRIQEASLEPAGDGQFLLRPVGRAGTYDVTLFGRGNGDLFTTFRWTTPVDGTLPTPQARLAVLANPDGPVDSYGVELELTNLAATPKQASARITVRAADGDAVVFDATRSDLGCLPEGTVYWDGPDEEGIAAAALGHGPFTYEVELVLDGARHVAEATWPGDQIAGNEPSVALHFTPGLPAL